MQFIALTAYDEASPENNVYELIISASDGTYITEQNLTLNVVADYEELAPIFSTAESVGVDEGIIDVFYTLEVYDPNGDTIGTTISGEHTQYFEIEETSSALSSKSFDFKLRSLTDYENPQITDNTYYITFTAADYKFTSDFTLTVHLDDLAELAPNLNLTEQSSDSLRVIFDSVSGMDAYTLYYSDDLACIEELCADTAIYTYSLVTGTSFTNLVPITPYYFRTTGYYTASGRAQLSDVYGYSTLYDSSASSVEINVVSDTSVNVTWDLQTEADDIDYRLYVYGNSDCSDDQLIEPDNDCEIFSADIHNDGAALIENLVAGSEYHFAILAINDVYGGWYPDTPSLTTPPLAVDGSTLKEQNLASTSLTLNWDEPDNGDDTSYAYNIIVCNPDCTFKFQGSTSSNSSQAISNLQPGTAHQFLISSLAASYEVNSSALSLTTVPEAVSLNSESDDTSISLDWSSTINGAATSYNIYRVCLDEADNCSAGLLTSTSETSHTFTDLNIGELYSFIVGANAGGLETNSSTVSLSTMPSTPANFSIEPLESNNEFSNLLFLSWSAAAQADGYRIYDQDDVLHKSISDATETNATLDHLIPGNNHSYYVVAYNEAGASAKTETITTTTLPRQDLDDDLAYSFTETKLDISWDSANGDGVEYIVNLFTCPVAEASCSLQSQNSAGNQQSITIEDLLPANSYEFNISIISNDLSLETASYSYISTPAAVEALSALFEPDGSTISLNWDNSNSDVATLSIYRYLCPDSSFSSCSAPQQLVADLDYTSVFYSDTAVALDEYYQYSVSVKAGSIEVNSSIVNVERAQATTPEEFSASVSTANVVSLQWQAASYHTSYTLTRTDGLNNSLSLSAPAADATSASDSSNIIPAELYTYELTAVNSFSQSEPASSSITSNPEVSSASITSIGADSLSVDITSANGSMAVYQLHVFDCTSGSCVLVVDGAATSELSASATEIPAGSYLQLNLSTSANGTSVSSANQEFTSLPAAVTELNVAVAIDGSAIDLSWESSNGSATELKVYRHVCTDASYSDCAFEQLLATLDYTATSYTDNQFELEPYYQYQIGALTGANEANSSIVNAAKPEVVAATNFIAAVQGSTTVAFSWDAASNHGGYVLSATDNLDTLAVEQSLSADQLSHTLSNLTPGEFYTFELNATSAYSSAATTTTAYTDIEPIAFTGFSAIGLDAATINLDNPNGSTVAHALMLELCGATCEQQEAPSVGTLAVGANQLQLDELEAGSQYQLTWQVDNHDSSASATTTLDPLYTHPAEPSDFVVLEVDSTSANIGFQSVNGASSTTSAHLLDCSSDPCVDSTDTNPSFTALGNSDYSYQLSGLVPGSDYSLSLSISNNGVTATSTVTGAVTASSTAVDQEPGEEIYLTLVRSNAAGTEVSQSVAVLTQPSPPNFSLSSVTSEDDQATVTISWTDNRASQDIDYYEAYSVHSNCSFSEALANSSKCGGVYVYNFGSSYSGSSYVDTSATETATTYYYYMIAANASGYVSPSSNDRKSAQPQYQQKVGNLYYSIDQDSTTFYWSLPDNNAADDIVVSNETGSSIKYLSKNTTSYTYDSVFGEGRNFNIYLRKNGNSGGTVTVIVSEHIPIDVGIQSPSVTVLEVGDARIQFTPVNQDENQSYDYQIFRHPADADTSCSIDPANCEDAVTFSASGLGNEQITYLDELGSHAQDYYYIVREILGSDSFSSYSDSVLAEFDFSAPEITQVFYQYDEELGQLGLTLSWSLVDPGERAITQMELFRYTDSGCNQLPDNYSSCDDPALYIDAYSESLSSTTLRYADELPTTEEYYYRLRATTAARGSELSAEIRVNPHVQLNDSGISRTVYYPSGDSGYASDCQDDDIVGVSDCESGRDAKEVLAKVGSGDESFDYTRIGSDGEPLEDQSGSYKSSGNNADGTYWHCVHDNVTGLTWDNNSVISYSDEYHYTEFSEIYTDMNSNAVCGHRDWRIPTVSELISIRDFGDDDDNHSPDEKVAADTGSLVNIQQGRYWTKDAAGDDYYLVDFRLWRQAVQVEAFADDGDHYAIFVRGPNLGGTSGIERYYLHPDHHLLIDNNARINAADTSDLTYGTIAWHPCFLGQSYDEATSECSGSPSEYDDWRDAMAAVDVFTTESGDYEYRLPNTKEVQTLLDTGAIEEYGHTLHPDTFKGVAALNSAKDYYLWTSSGSVEDDDESFAFRIASGECCASVDRNNPDTSDNKTYIILPLFISEYVIREH